MPIAKKPKSKKERDAEAFIRNSGRGQVALSTAHKIPVMIRLDMDLLDRVDAEAKRLGLSRSAMITSRIADLLGR